MKCLENSNGTLCWARLLEIVRRCVSVCICSKITQTTSTKRSWETNRFARDVVCMVSYLRRCSVARCAANVSQWRWIARRVNVQTLQSARTWHKTRTRVCALRRWHQVVVRAFVPKTHTHTHTYIWDGNDPANTDHKKRSHTEQTNRD